MDIKLPLSELQQKVLGCIFRYLRDYEYPPTIPEIQKDLAITNPGTVFGTLTGLEKKDYIYRNGKQIPRNIRLTPLGEELFNSGHQMDLF